MNWGFEMGSEAQRQSTLAGRGVEWNGDVGLIDLCDICTKRAVFCITLDNGQIADCATVTVVINPFPRKGQPHVCSKDLRVHTPGIQSKMELERYAKALFQAGVWQSDFND